jgi:hypothetical protein
VKTTKNEESLENTTSVRLVAPPSSQQQQSIATKTLNTNMIFDRDFKHREMNKTMRIAKKSNDHH